MATALPIADKPTLDIVNTNVGSNVDAASEAGSVHAKLKKINFIINSGNIVQASSEVQAEYLTPFSYKNSGSKDILKFFIPYSGTVRLTFEAYAELTDGSAKAVFRDPLSNTTTSVIITGTAYTGYSKDITVCAGMYIVVNMAGINSTYAWYLKNFRISYTINTGPAITTII